MKKLTLLFICPLMYMGCNESDEQTTASIKKMPLVIEPMISILPVRSSAVVNFTEPAQKIIVSTKQPSIITGSKGLKIMVDPASLEPENGTAIGQTIEVRMKEITNQEELFKNNAPTICSGKLLISGGSYYIEMFSAGNKLRVKNGKSLKINVPSYTAGKMELFYGERDANGILNWQPAGDQMNARRITSVSIKQKSKKTAITVAEDSTVSNTVTAATELENLFSLADRKNNRLSVAEFDSATKTKRDNTTVQPAPVYEQLLADSSAATIGVANAMMEKQLAEAKLVQYYYPAEIKRLGWINCDRFYNTPKKSEIQFECDSSFIPSIASVYIVFKRINSMQEEFINFTNNTRSAKLLNQYPAGELVKLIVITNTDGKFYAHKQELILGSKELIKLKFNPVPDVEMLKASYYN